MKRILVVSPFVPYPPDRGHRVRIFWLMRQLALHYRVGLVTQCYFRSDRDAATALRDAFPGLDPVVAVQSPAHRSPYHRGWYAIASRVAIMAGFPRERIYHSSRALREAVNRVVGGLRPHLVQGEYWFSRWAIPPVSGAMVWLDSIDLHWLRIQRESLHSAHGWPRGVPCRHARIIGRHELAAYRSVDRVFTVHEVEADVLRKRLHDVPISTLPIAYEVPAQPIIWQPGAVVLFIGAMDYSPNRDAVWFLAREVMPAVRMAMPEATLRVTGHLHRVRELPQDEWIHYTGYVADLQEALEGVGAAAAPLRLGSGTSVKVLSVLGLGLPLVASSRAVEGLPLTPGVHYLRADDAADTSTALSTLLANGAYAQALGRCGHQVAREEFDWHHTAARVAALYDEGLSQ